MSDHFCVYQKSTPAFFLVFSSVFSKPRFWSSYSTSRHLTFEQIVRETGLENVHARTKRS